MSLRALPPVRPTPLYGQLCQWAGPLVDRGEEMQCELAGACLKVAAMLVRMLGLKSHEWIALARAAWDQEILEADRATKD